MRVTQCPNALQSALHERSMGLFHNLQMMFGSILNAILPLSSESMMARELNEETLRLHLNPVSHTRNPWIYCLFRYSDPKIRALMRAIKYRGEKAPLGPLGKVAAEEAVEIIKEKMLEEGWKEPIITPVPSSAKRLRSRGYNQADRIVLAMLPFLRDVADYAPDILGREDRPSQVSIPREKRHENIENAFFALRPDKVHGRYVIILDDVVESGSTLEDARRALITVGAVDVIAIAISH